jgi:chromate transporter
VVALILVPAIRLILDKEIKWKMVWLPILATVLIWYFKISPVTIIVITAVGSLIYGAYTLKKLKK